MVEEASYECVRRNGWETLNLDPACLLTVTNTNKPFIWNLQPVSAAHTNHRCLQQQLILSANVASPLSIISGTISNDRQTRWHKHTHNSLIGCFPSLSSLQLNETRKCARIILAQRHYTSSQAFTPGTIKCVCSRCMIQTIDFTCFINLNNLMSRRIQS